MLLQVLHDLQKLTGHEAIGVGQREQQRLHVIALRSRLDGIARHWRHLQVALEREDVNRVRVVPSTSRHRGVGLVAVDQDPVRTLQATVHQRDQNPVAGQDRALRCLVREQMLVGRRELGRQRQRGLGRGQRVAGQRMLGPSEVTLQVRPQADRGRVVALRQLEAARLRQRDPVGRCERVADGRCGLDRVALERFLQPRSDARRPRFRRIRRAGFYGGEAQGKGHDISIIGLGRRL